MKVLWISELFPPSTGGVQQYLSNLVLNMSGCRSVVVTRKAEGEGPADADMALESAGHTVYRVEDWPACTDPRVVYRSLNPLLKLAGFVGRAVASEAISVVVIGQVSFALLLMLFFLKISNGPPVVLIFHGEEIPVIPFKSNALRRRLIKMADLGVCNSDFTRSTLHRFMGGVGKTVISYPGVEDKFFLEADCSQLRERFGTAGRRVIYTLGRLDLRKGHDLVIEALPAIIQEVPNILYLVGGTGRNLERLKGRAAELKVESHVLFCGFIPDEEVVAFHRLGEVFVMPNRTLPDGDTEGFGIVFLEANACGNPVIGGASGGACDAIEDGATGYLVDSLHPGSLSDKILYLLSRPEEARTMGEAGRRRAWERFRWPQIAAKLEKEFVELQRSFSR